MRTAKSLIRLGGCPCWSESSMGAHSTLLVLSWGGSIVFYKTSEGLWVRAWIGVSVRLFSVKSSSFFHDSDDSRFVTFSVVFRIWRVRIPPSGPNNWISLNRFCCGLFLLLHATVFALLRLASELDDRKEVSSWSVCAYLTQICLVESSIRTNWTIPFDAMSDVALQR